MDIKGKLFGKNKDVNLEKPEPEIPEEFDLTDEAKDAINDADDINIKDFIAKKQALKAEKEAKKTKKEEDEPEETDIETPKIEEKQEPIQEKQSNFAKIMTIYLDKNNVEQTKKTLKQAIEGEYLVGMQAGIEITKENFEKVSTVLNYFAHNGYLVVISGEKVEPVFNETAK